MWQEMNLLFTRISLFAFTFPFGHFFNSLPHNPDFKRPPSKKPFENMVGKGENAGNQHLLLSNNVFYPIKDRNHHLS